jgi:hypothetical protein
MIDLLKAGEIHYNNANNIFCPEAMVKLCDSIVNNSSDKTAIMQALNKKANAYLQLGEEQKAIDIFQDVLKKIPPGNFDQKHS